MGKVKSAFEIAMEKAAKIGTLSLEEKEKIKDEEKVIAILKEFYQGWLDSNTLWQRLKGSNPSLLTMAQINVIDSLSLGTSQEEFQIRKQGILAAETLKENPNTAMIESGLHAIETLQKEYQEMKEQVAADLKRQVEKNPQLRMRPVTTPDGRAVMQMTVSVDEAVKARLVDYLLEHEKQYNQAFSEVIEELKMVLK
jgi:predicted CopG family antitoxin